MDNIMIVLIIGSISDVIQLKKIEKHKLMKSTYPKYQYINSEIKLSDCEWSFLFVKIRECDPLQGGPQYI